MKALQMVDLKGQYQHIKAEIDEAVLSVVQSCAYINGPEVKAFEEELEEYLGVKHVIPCANGTDALQITLMAMGFKPGDEVITASFTYIATAEAIALLGLVPVLVDVEPDTMNIDPDAIEAAISDKTVAIMPVHLFGQCANMDQIMEISKKHNLRVIEDTAQAVSASYTFNDGTKKMAGSIGDAGTTSFFPSKNLGCFGDGGAIFTNDDELAQSIAMVANHGQSKRYYHDRIGVNSRLDSMQAAILRIKLRHLNEYSEARQKAAAYYDNAFKNSEFITAPVRNPNSSHVFHQYTLKLDKVDRQELINHLSDKGVPSMIYYPVAIHEQKAFKKVKHRVGDLSNTEKLTIQVLSLPMHTEHTDDTLEYITSSVLEFLNKKILI
ncbi:MAG: DegT/DnrJ/EryC1/StrS family aminotransferase [Bacteroidia bacterium]|nr:DegT/DnrJ/EryC1/StrS family aminotransferase [Bacteroidia bacterium]